MKINCPKILTSLLVLTAILAGTFYNYSPAFTQTMAPHTCLPRPYPPDQLNTLLRTKYTDYKEQYFTTSGTSDAIRVGMAEKWKENPQDRLPENSETTSESMGYGMLAAIAGDDKDSFLKMLQYVESHSDQYGRMWWRIEKDGTILPQNRDVASDGDVDITAATIRAYQKGWTSIDPVITRLNGLRKYVIDTPGGVGKVMTPGNWGNTMIGTDRLFLSSLKEISAFTQAQGWRGEPWEEVYIGSKFALDKLILKNQNMVVFPDWFRTDGSLLRVGEGELPSGPFSYYDSTRYPYRLAEWLRMENCIEPFIEKKLLEQHLFYKKEFYTVDDQKKEEGLYNGYYVDGRRITNLRLPNGTTPGTQLNEGNFLLNAYILAMTFRNPQGSDDKYIADLEALLAAQEPYAGYFLDSVYLMWLTSLHN